MIEILFRAKRTVNGEWIEGYVFELHPGQYVICDRKQYDRASTLPVWEFLRYCTYEIDKRTLCQYTGLKDKDGNRIWEHDFLSVNTYDYEEPANDYFGEVIYMDSWMCWCIQSDDDEYPIHLCECEGSYKTEIYVIGNSIDNPELLEVKK